MPVTARCRSAPDNGLLTFILQDEVGGLGQIGGEMIDAPARPGMYLMNLGEMLETATDGYLKATPHRVVSLPPGPANLDRLLLQPSLRTAL